jgi:hypothetical protein
MRLQHYLVESKPIGSKQKMFQKKFEGWFKTFDPEKQVMIAGGRKGRYPNIVPRYYYHRPPGGEEVGRGAKAYKNRSADGSQEAMDSDFGVKVDKVIWLSPDPYSYGKNMLKIDLAQLDPMNMRTTGQAEGNVWHKGDIPERAIVR